MKHRVGMFALRILLSFIVAQPVLSAEFHALIVQEDNLPLEYAVVALVPAQRSDFSDLPVAIMDQRENIFVPHVLAIRTNTQVRFPNSDDVRHHVYSFSPAKKFELRLYHGLTADPVLFDKAGTVVLGCNIHDSMLAYIYVVDTEYFAVSNVKGEIKITAPAGNYELQVNHPRLMSAFTPAAVQLSDTAPHRQKIKLNELSDLETEASTDELSNLF